MPLRRGADEGARIPVTSAPERVSRSREKAILLSQFQHHALVGQANLKELLPFLHESEAPVKRNHILPRMNYDTSEAILAGSIHRNLHQHPPNSGSLNSLTNGNLTNFAVTGRHSLVGQYQTANQIAFHPTRQVALAAFCLDVRMRVHEAERFTKHSLTQGNPVLESFMVVIYPERFQNQDDRYTKKWPAVPDC